MISKYLSRFSSSDRGETYNILTWPFLMATLAYGVGFVLFSDTESVGQSSLHLAMLTFGAHVSFVWGLVAVLTIVVGISYLLFRTPPFGRVSGLMGFMVWIFASWCWLSTGGYLLFLGVGAPNLYFWIWQYFSLSKFKREVTVDKQTMTDYDSGRYDDKLNPKDSKISRDDNRGRDVQTYGSYDDPDDGGDTSRRIEK